MVFNYGKINIKNLAIGFISLFLAFMVAYYVQSDNENSFENFAFSSKKIINAQSLGEKAQQFLGVLM